MKCNGLCNYLSSVSNKGNYTHQPPVNSHHVLISESDVNGNPQKQYFV
jgi:hypothetical protein